MNFELQIDDNFEGDRLLTVTPLPVRVNNGASNANTGKTGAVLNGWADQLGEFRVTDAGLVSITIPSAEKCMLRRLDAAAQDWAMEIEWIQSATSLPAIQLRYGHVNGLVQGYEARMLASGALQLTGFDDNGSSTWLGNLASTAALGLVNGTRYIMRAYIAGTSLWAAVYAASAPHTALHAPITATNSSVTANGACGIGVGQDSFDIGTITRAICWKITNTSNGGMFLLPKSVGKTSITFRRTPSIWGHASPTSRHIHQSTSRNFTAAVGNIAATIGANDNDVTISGLLPDTLYSFRGTNLVSGSYVACNDLAIATRLRDSMAVGVMSDSTWAVDVPEGAGADPTGTQAHYLQQLASTLLNRDVTVYNGSTSGRTAATIVSSGDAATLITAMNADTSTVKVFLIEFGLNDARAGGGLELASVYRTNLIALKTLIWATIPAAIIVYNYPSSMFPMMASSGVAEDVPVILETYFAEIDAIVAADTTGKVFAGDKQNYKENTRRSSNFRDGLHRTRACMMRGAGSGLLGLARANGDVAANSAADRMFGIGSSIG